MSAGPWTVKLEVDFTTQPGSTPTAWVDLTSRLRDRGRVTITSGRAGTATFQLNNRDRALDPTNPSSPYNLVPMRHARLTATVDGKTYPLFRGFVEEWPPVWPDAKQGHVNVRLVDATAWLALLDADVDRPAETSQARLVALLDLAGWPTNLRDVPAGVVEVEAYEQTSANLLRTVEDTVAAEDGDLYVSPDGKLTFRSRHARLDLPVTTATGIGGRPVKSVDPDYGGGRMVNIGRAELADGDVFETRDDASVATYGPRLDNVRDLPLSGAEAEGVALWLVYRYAEPHVSLSSLTMEGRHDGTLPDVLQRRIGDRVSFTHEPPGGGQAQVDGHIERIHHTIGGGSWEVSWDLSPYFGEGPWFRLDESLIDGPAGLAP